MRGTAADRSGGVDDASTAAAASRDLGRDHRRNSLAPLVSALRRFWAGRPVALLLPRLTPGAEPVLAELRRYGADVVAVVTADEPIPGSPAVRHLWNCAERGGAMDRQGFEAWLRDPDPELGRWLDRIDPARRLLMLGNQHADVPALFERRLYGWRRPEWARWEDKIRIEPLWRQVGVPSPAHVIGSLDDPVVRGAADLDRGLGLVLASDSSRGIWGGSRGLRWVRDPGRLGAGTQTALEAALESLRGHTERVRVAAFLPGVPCSVLGLVLRDGVAVFDPLEVITLRDPAQARLLLCGTSTRWRPSPDLAEQIRSCARRAGEWLAANCGLRGLFSVDGIATVDGFRATELNPRLSGGWGLDSALPELSENLLHRAVQERLPGIYDADPCSLEYELRAAVAGHPSHDIVIPHVRQGGIQPEGAPGEPGNRPAPRQTAVGGVRLTWVPAQGDAAELLRVEPWPRAGLLGPPAAALASTLTGTEISGADVDPRP